MITLALGVFAIVSFQDGGIMDRLKFEGEGRMRGEATFNNVDANNGNEIDDRYRGRMRFRFGAKYQVMENLSLGARLSTASDGNDANNAYWDFGDGDGFNGGNIVMDRFYLDYAACEETHILFGKQPNAFATPPVFGEFVWDSDISPAGVSAVWKPMTDGGASFDARVAAYVATEVAADKDPKMLGAQGNVSIPIDELNLKLSTALYDWRDNDDTAVAGNQGNSATTEDFSIWEAFAAGTMQGGPMDEMTGFLQYMDNLDSSDSGVALGAQLGATKWERGNYNAFLVFYDLDGDSVFSPVAQDDTPVGGTGLNDGDGDGMSGMLFGGTYWLRDNVSFKIWVLTSNASGADDDPIRLRFDLDFRVK